MGICAARSLCFEGIQGKAVDVLFEFGRKTRQNKQQTTTTTTTTKLGALAYPNVLPGGHHATPISLSKETMVDDTLTVSG